MRIVLVTHYFPGHRGGIERVAGELAARLAARGVELEWHASDTDAPPSLPGVRVVSAPSWNGLERASGVPYPLWSPTALRRLRRAVHGADAVHLHDCLYLPQIVACTAGRPVLVTQHVGWIPFRNPLARAAQWSAHHSVARLVLGGAAQVVFVSETVRAYFSGFVRFKAPPLVVANGVDSALFHPAAESERARLRGELGVAPTTPLLLFAGRFVEKKGLALLHRLAADIGEAHWLFAGWGRDDPAAWRLPNVAVLRGRSGASLAALYQAADLLVLPSVGEGFPLVVQEAMACGTPALIGSDTAQGCPDAAGVLLAEDTQGDDAASRWQRRIRSLIAPGGPLLALRARVAAFAAAHWSWDDCGARYEELLRRAARGA